MGSCISKCRSKKKPKEDHIVHDKLVITQSRDPVSIINHPQINDLSDRRPVSPAPSSVSSASISTFSCSNGQCSTTTSSLSMSLGSSCRSSTALCPNDRTDRSFSNEFLKSCVKENPHVLIGLNQTKKNFENSLVHSRKFVVQEKLLDQIVQYSTPRKRARASSPIESKSNPSRGIMRSPSPSRRFTGASSPIESNPGRGTMRSPSPSRRFTGETNSTNGVKVNSCRASSPVVSRTNKNISAPSCKKRESWRALSASPNHDLARRNAAIMSKRDVITQQVNAKIDDISIGGVEYQEMDLILEDIDNPLISLDCFIFL